MAVTAKTPPTSDPQKRATDSGGSAAVFRASSRIFRLNNAWYFSSREGEQGPFESESAAKKELETYIKLLVSPEVDGDSVPFTTSDKPVATQGQPAESDVDKQVWDKYDLLN